MEFIPIIGLDAFLEEHALSRELQYHEILGERSIDSPHKHDFYVLLLVEAGKGYHRIDGMKYKIGKNQLHVLYPGQVHDWKFEKTTRVFQLMISRETFSTIQQSIEIGWYLFQEKPVLTMPQKEFTSLQYEFLQLGNELSQTVLSWKVIQARSIVLLQLIFRLLENREWNSISATNKVLVSEYLKLIERYYLKEKSVEFFARKLHVTANYLNIVCKRNLNKNAKELLQNRILMEAKRRLLISEQSIKEIAYALGFDDPAYFSNVFKLKAGLSPAAFRNK